MDISFFFSREFVFLSSILFIMVTIPFVILSFIFYWIRTKFLLRYKLGYYKIYDIFFLYQNEMFKIEMFIENIQIRIVWFRIQISLKGARVICELNRKNCNENNLVKREATQENSQRKLIPQEIRENNSQNEFEHKKKEFLNILKKKFQKQKNLKFVNENSKFNPFDKNRDSLEGIIKFKKSQITFFERVLRCLVTYFEVEIKNVKVVLKISQRNFYHNLNVENILIGLNYQKNKNYRLNLIAAISDLQIGEFIKLDEDYNFNHYIQDDFCKFNNLIQINSTILRIAFNGSLFTEKKQGNLDKFTTSPANNISILGEVIDIKAIISNKSLKNLFRLITDLMQIGDTPEDSNDKDINEFESIDDMANLIPVEQHILNKVKSHFKKLKIIINNPEILVFSDDYLNHRLAIKAEQFTILIRNVANKYINNETTTILATTNEIKIHELALYSIKKTSIEKGYSHQSTDFLYKNSLISMLPLFSINIQDRINYDFKLSYCEFTTNLVSELPQIGQITMSTKDLEKILEIVMTIVDGIDMIDYIIAIKDIKNPGKKRVDKLTKTAHMQFKYNSMELTLYDNLILVELNKMNLDLKISERNKSKEILIKFSPMLFSFRNCEIDMMNKQLLGEQNSFNSRKVIHSVSNLILNEFSLSIKDSVISIGEKYFPNKIKNSEIIIKFPNSAACLYDDHLIYIIEFVSSFLTPILGQDIKKKYKSLLNPDSLKKKKFYKEKREKIELNFDNVELINYIDNEDILSFNFTDMKMVIDQFMEIPKLKIYHQSNCSKKLLLSKTKIIELDSLQIKFDKKNEFTSAKQIEVSMKNTYINAYCMEILTTLIKLSNFYIFFPEWVNYHFQDRYMIDSKTYREKYVIETIKKEKVLINFQNIFVEIKDGNIFTCGILHADLKKLQEMQNDNQTIKYLSGLKKSLFSMKITNFDIEVNNHREFIIKKVNYANDLLEKVFYSCSSSIERKISKMSNKDFYYKTIIKKADTELRFEEIEIRHDYYKLFGLRDFYINIKNDAVLKNFDLQNLQDNLLIYRHHNLLTREVKYDQDKDHKVNLMLKDLRINFDDVKLFDDTLSFAFKVINQLEKFQLKKHVMLDYSNILNYETSSILNIHITNLEGSINSLDPVTKKIYNRLILKIHYTGINLEKNSKENLDIAEISVYFMSFGFDPSQKAGYPLLTVPIAEVNIDNSKNIIRISIPNANAHDMMMKYTSKTEINSSSYSEVYRPELENLLVETRSITLFVNFKYLSTFVKIFEIFWEKTKFLRKSFGSAIVPIPVSSPNTVTKENHLKNLNNSEREKIITKPTFSTRDATSICLTNNNSNQGIINESNFSSTGSNNSQYTAITKPYINPNSALYLSTPIINRQNNLTFNTNRNNNKHKNIQTPNSINIYSQNTNNNQYDKNVKDKTIILTVFDLKIVYLLEYKESYESVFKFNEDIKKEGYFGYIMRLFSFSMKYKIKAMKFSDSLKINTDLFTVSFLTKENFDDDIFFKNDREIYLEKFFNLKNSINFNELMELPELKKSRFLNSSTKFFLEYESVPSVSVKPETSAIEKHSDLLYDHKHTLLKVSTISFKRKSKLNANVEDIWIEVKNLKITWNKFNKDVVQLLIFEDVLLIVDKIILKVDLKKKGKEKEKITFLDLGRFNFNFKIYNPQIAIQNEIKKSTMLLMNKEPCQAIISKVCMDETSKDFTLEVIYDKLCLYSFHNYTQNQNTIYWIGDSEENNFFLEESLFKKILETPVIRFKISQNVKSKTNDEFSIFTYVNISVKKIYAEFEGPLFNDFLNIIEVFIFDRGYSLAEEKSNEDSKKNDMVNYKINELENLIKSHYKFKGNKIIQKEIIFSLDQVELILAKVGKPLFQLLIKNFEGDHYIFFDNSSDTKMNIRNIQIKNIEHKSNEILLSSANHHENLGGLEDKIDMLVFRKRDSYTGIGTDSQWYTLDYFELSLRPLKINISKSQIEFFVDFFFKNKVSEVNEEEQRIMLLNASKYRELTNANIKKEEIVVKKIEKKEDEEYPIYFKQFKINDTELILNFHYAEGPHVLNMNNARIKFSNFYKSEKFYQSKVLLDRFVSHCSKQCAKNLPSIVASLLRTGNESPKTANVDEDEHRKLLFGRKNN